MTFEKMSDNGLLLDGSDIFRFQISIHTLKLDVAKSARVAENIRQWPLRKYQQKVLPSRKISDNGLRQSIRQWHFVIWFRSF